MRPTRRALKSSVSRHMPPATSARRSPCCSAQVLDCEPRAAWAGWRSCSSAEPGMRSTLASSAMRCAEEGYRLAVETQQPHCWIAGSYIAMALLAGVQGHEDLLGVESDLPQTLRVRIVGQQRSRVAQSEVEERGGTSRSGCSATNASSSPTKSACPPSARSASIRSSKGLSLSSVSRAISLTANGWEPKSARAGSRHRSRASWNFVLAAAGAPSAMDRLSASIRR